MMEKKKRGFGAMSPARRREVARKGGLAVSQRPGLMQELGRLGGKAISSDRAHMAKIGRKGGQNSRREARGD